MRTEVIFRATTSDDTSFKSIQTKEGLTTLKIVLKGKGVIIEPGRLQYLEGNITVKEPEQKKRNPFKMFWQKATTGIDIFRKEYTGSGTVYIGPPTWGTFKVFQLGKGEQMYIESDSFVACESGINLSSNVTGLKAGLSGEGLFNIEATNEGETMQQIAIHAKGEVVEKQIHEHNPVTVDGGLAIAWEKGVTMTTEFLGGSLLTKLTSGEGLVNKFTGNGKLWMVPNPSKYEQQMAEIRKMHKVTRNVVCACRRKSSS